MLLLDGEKTALVAIDLQHGILALPLTPLEGTHVVSRSVELGRAIAQAGGLVVLVNVAYAADYADRPNQPVDAALKLPADGLPRDWATIVPEILALPAAVHITKRQQSAFFGTELDLQLRRRGITTVVLSGLATNFGVESTARDAYNLNYAVVVASDACSSTGPGLHDFALTHTLPRFSRLRPTADIVAALDFGQTDREPPQA